MNTKALIYCRVSSDRQVNEGNGLDSQEQRCRKYASSNGYTVMKIFRDEGVSGGLFERPAMRELIRYLDEHPVEQFAIIFDDLTRFARDMEVHLKLKSELRSRGATLYCLNLKIDDTEERQLIENVSAAVAQYERQKNRRQVLQKMKARLELGFWVFGPPLGLVNIKDPIRGKILVSEEPYASIFKQAIEGYASDIFFTYKDVQMFIQGEYDRVGIEKKISKDGAYRILSNILYAGYIEYLDWGIERKKGQHTGFISYDTFLRVQDKIQKRSKPHIQKKTNQDFPLRGFVTCSLCLRPMTASWNKGRTRKYPNYFCNTKDCIRRYKVINRDKIENGFIELLNTVKPFPEVVELLKDVVTDIWQTKKNQEDSYKKQTQTRIKEVEKLITRYCELAAKSTDSSIIDNYEKQIKKYEEEKKSLLNASALPNIYTKEAFGTATDTVLETIKNPVGMWQSEFVEQKKTILSMYFDDKIAYDPVSGFGTAHLAYPIELMSGFSKPQSAYVWRCPAMNRSPKMQHKNVYTRSLLYICPFPVSQ